MITTKHFEDLNHILNFLGEISSTESYNTQFFYLIEQ